MALASAAAVTAQRERFRKEAAEVQPQVSHKSSKSINSSRSDKLQTTTIPDEAHCLSCCVQGSLPNQELVGDMYEKAAVTIFVACLITANFLVSVMQAQMLPVHGSNAHHVFQGLEVFFNVVFLLELLVNMYANFFLRFWCSAWNIFDFLIVMISITSMLATNLPGITVLRLFRAFRVFRLFKRIRCLQMILIGIGKSIPGVRDALVVLGLIMAIWAIIGVNFFGDKDAYKLYYGDFGKAMLTQLQIMTLDSWASQIARPIIFNESPVYAVYFVSYILINGVIMTNIVVAILLDSFIVALKSCQFEDEPMPEPEEKDWTWDSSADDIIGDLDTLTSKTLRYLKPLSRISENTPSEGTLS